MSDRLREQFDDLKIIFKNNFAAVAVEPFPKLEGGRGISNEGKGGEGERRMDPHNALCRIFVSDQGASG